MNGKNGGPKYSTRADRNKVYPSRFRHLRIWGEKNGVRIIGERSMFLVRPRMSDVLLLLAWAMGIWAIMVLCVGKIFMLLRRGLAGILSIGPEVWIGEWSHGCLHLRSNFFWDAGFEDRSRSRNRSRGVSFQEKRVTHILHKKSFVFFLFLSGNYHSFFLLLSFIWLFFFFRERGMYIIIRLVDLCSLLCCFRVAAYDFINEKKIALYILFSIYLPYLTPLRVQYI